MVLGVLQNRTASNMFLDPGCNPLIQMPGVEHLQNMRQLPKLVTGPRVV